MASVRQPPPSPPAPPPARSLRLALVALVLLVLAAYANSFRVPFLFDDEPSIVHNPTLSSLWRAWWPPTGDGSTVSGRPLLNVSFALNRAFGGNRVWGYHAVNLLIHLAAGATLFGIVRRTLLTPPWPRALALRPLPSPSPRRRSGCSIRCKRNP